MYRNTLIILAFVTILLALAACKEQTSPTTPPAPAAEAPAATAPADSTTPVENINKDNMASELDKVEKGIQQDEAAGE